jgi:hypothetical protein
MDRLVIESVRDTGPTDGSGDDTLYVVRLREGDGAAETLRFSVAGTYGRPSERELAEMVAVMGRGFAHGHSAVEQFRERGVEHPEGSGRMVVLVRPVEE